MSNIRALVYPYLAMAWRQRWWSVLLAWVVCLVAWGGIMLIPNKYEASARLYIDSDAVLTPLLKGIGLESAPASQIDMLHRTLLRRPNIEALIARTSLRTKVNSPPAMEMLANRLATEVKVTTPAKNLFSVTYTDTDPTQAYEVVNTLLAIFIESWTAANRAETENARRFLSEQIGLYEDRLTKAEARKNGFHDRYADLLPDPASGQSHLDSLTTQVASMRMQLLDQQLKLDILQKELKATPAVLSADAEDARHHPAVTAGPELTRAELELESLRLRYTDANPDVERARELVARLRASGIGAQSTASMARMMPNPTYERVKKDIVDAEFSIASLTRHLATMTQDRDRMLVLSREAPNAPNDYVTIKREYDDVYNGHAELVRRREAMRLTEAADARGDKAKVQIVDPPAVPLNPVFPKRRFLMSAALLLGLCAGAGLPLVLKQFDHSFHSLLDLEILGLPIIGGVSAIEEQRRRLRKMAGVSALVFCLLLLVAVTGVLLLRVCEV